jgi:myo-inositol 2-dehydrogenase/D-chiro-inositol 1-dehydrogenase
MAGRQLVCLNMNTTTPPSAASRRTFLKTAALASATMAAPAILPGKLFAADNAETVRVGLIGCGGRGTGAAANALRADPNVVLTALGDVFPEPLEGSLKALQSAEDISARVKVTSENRFIGLDAYQKVLASGVDVVLLTAPPAFRPFHLEAAVAAGKHVFAEKPVAVDATGVRSILASAAAAKARNLALVAGFCYRYNTGVRAFMEQIHNGTIGDIRTIHTTYNTGGVWCKPRQAGWTDVEWQMRNWYYFTWLSGDHIVEQAVHNVDKMAWLMKDVPPLSCMAIGGRQVRTEEQFGHIYDHFGVVYDYPNDVRAFHFCRQQAGAAADNSDHVWGADGVGHIVRAFSGPFVIRGKTNWRHREEKMRDMYQNEHDELFASIRSGKPINDGEWMAHSTLLAIMGRMAAYTGQVVTWEEALNSKEDLFPKQLRWDMPLPVPPVAMPGVTKLV